MLQLYSMGGKPCQRKKRELQGRKYALEISYLSWHWPSNKETCYKKDSLQKLKFYILKGETKQKKLQLFYNLHNGLAPQYLCELIPPTIQSTTIYPLRNGNDLIVPFCRLSLTNSSFIPSTVREWNKLDLTVRNLDTLSSFKNTLRREGRTRTTSVPKHFLYGPRKLNIHVILTQLRCSASFLNNDLFGSNIIQSSTCQCDAPQEDAYHFFF